MGDMNIAKPESTNLGIEKKHLSERRCLGKTHGGHYKSSLDKI